MNLEAPHDATLQKDIENIAADLQQFQELYNTTFLITGASGLLGSLLVKSLLCMNRCYGANISVLALVRNMDKARLVYGTLMDVAQLKVIRGDILQLPAIQESIDYIIHGASATSSKYFVEHPIETIHTAINGTENMLHLAKSKNIKGMVYLSSLEVYGTMNSNELVSEDQGGYIDPLSIRSSYSESKRMAENLCCAYSSQYNVPIRIARLTQTFGAGVDYDDNRVFAQFARSIIEEKDIVLHTTGSTIRNYCYTSDAIRALVYILLKGETGHAYNVANQDAGISIIDMAKLALTFGTKSKILFELSEDSKKLGYNPTVKIYLDTSKLGTLNWEAKVGLTDMYRSLIDSMRHSRANNGV